MRELKYLRNYQFLCYSFVILISEYNLIPNFFISFSAKRILSQDGETAYIEQLEQIYTHFHLTLIQACKVRIESKLLIIVIIFD